MVLRTVILPAMVMMVALVVSGCGAPPADEMYARAQEAHDGAQRTLDSLGRNADVHALFTPVASAYEQVATEYPSSLQAEQSLFKAAELYAGYLQNVPKAIEVYKRFGEGFPASTKAPTALFMVGYLYNNQLGMTDSAEVAYRKFLSLYPQNELATSAQFELETLGQDPQELLPPPTERNVVTSKSKPKTASPH